MLEACKLNGIKKIVMSSSPSTRFPYPDPNIEGLTEDQLIVINNGQYTPVFLQPYAETKAMGEKAVRDACGSKVPILRICDNHRIHFVGEFPLLCFIGSKNQQL